MARGAARWAGVACVALLFGLSACARPANDAASAAKASSAPKQAAPVRSPDPLPPEPLPAPPVPEPGVRAEPEADMPLAAGSAVAAARSLYDLHMRLHASGLPVGEDLARYRPLLSQRLLALMAPAARERDRAIAQTPDLKPPYIEGDMFTGLSEGATGYTLGKRTALGPDRESVDLEFVHDDGSGPPTRWRGRVLMVREDGSWKLDEVEYGDFDAGVRGDFVRAGSLSDWFK